MKIKLKKTGFSLFCVVILLSVLAYPVVAQEYKETLEIDYIRVNYGDRIDNDADGEVDEADENDVGYGTVNITDFGTVLNNTWYNDFLYPEWLPKRTMISAYYEGLIRVRPEDLTTLSPTYDGYFVDTCEEIFGITNTSAKYLEYTNVIPLLSFYVSISSSDLMNGASQIYYRSPIDIDFGFVDGNRTNPHHGLNIFDEEGNIVFASINFTKKQPLWPKTPYNASAGDRTYFQINMPFETNKKYRFVEYIQTIDDNAIDHIDLWISYGSDIANDGNTDTYIFPNTGHSVLIPAEASWGMNCIFGKSQAGFEKVILHPAEYGASNTTVAYCEIYSHRFSGTMNNVTEVNITIPMRFSSFTSITPHLDVWSGGSHAYCLGNVIDGASGTIHISFYLNMFGGDPDPTQPNDYVLTLRVGVTDSSDIYTFLTYPVANANLPSYYGGNGGYCQITWYGSGIHTATANRTEVVHMPMWVELTSERQYTPPPAVPGGTNHNASSINMATVLVGVTLVVVGALLVLTVVGAPVGVALAGIGWGAIATLVVGTTITGVGAYFIVRGLEGANILEASADILGLIARIPSLIGDFFEWLYEGLVNVVLEIWKWVQVLIDYGGLILSYMFDVIGFIAFLIVLWGWTLFLGVMKYVSRGDIEGAFASIKNPIRRSRRQATKITRYAGAKKTARAKRIKSERLKGEAEQEREYKQSPEHYRQEGVQAARRKQEYNSGYGAEKKRLKDME